MTSFANFAAAIKTTGIAHNSGYICEIYPPPYAQQYSAQLLEALPFYVENVNLPEIGLSTRRIHDNGTQREVVYDRFYGMVTMTFYSDQGMSIKQFFDYWLQSTTVSRGGRFMYPADYTTQSIMLHQVNSEKNKVYTVELKNAFPRTIDDVGLASNGNGALSFRVQWVYEYWTSYQNDEYLSTTGGSNYIDALNISMNRSSFVGNFQANTSQTIDNIIGNTDTGINSIQSTYP